MNPTLSPFSVFVFDLDNTLALSKGPIDTEMAVLLSRLLEKTRVAVISGGKFEQIRDQVAEQLPPTAHLEHLAILPTSGAALYTYEGNTWKLRHEERLSEEDIARIEDALEQAIQETAVVDERTPSHGERIENRGAEVTFSALGQQAPIPEKLAWDPDMSKRRLLRDAVAKRLPGYDVKLGGSTSVDTTKRGVNKAFGIRKLSEYIDIPIADMLYIGDQLSEGGNDEVVKETGIATRSVKNPGEAKEFINSLFG
jgi:phosphomannomutase